MVGGGLIYALDSEAHVFVFRAADGRPVWDKRLAPKNGTDMPTLWGLLGKPNTIDPPQGMGGGVAYDDGKIFVTTGFGVVICMDAKTGRDIWRKDLGMPIVNAPVVNGGRVFVSTHDNHFYALAEADGRQLWDHQGIAESAGILASHQRGGVGRNRDRALHLGRTLRAARPERPGRLERCAVAHRPCHRPVRSSTTSPGRPVIDRGVVYAISQSGLMAAFSVNTGERLWSRDIGGIQTPWAAGDYVYVLDNNARVICLTRKEGKVRWIHQLPQYEDPEDKKRPHHLGRAGAGVRQADRDLVQRLCRGALAL